MLVDETNKIYLKGINETIIQTLGKLTIALVIEGKEIKSEFHLVPRDFPILKNGILGDNFLMENRPIINVADKTLIIDFGIESNGQIDNETHNEIRDKLFINDRIIRDNYELINRNQLKEIENIDISNKIEMKHNKNINNNYNKTNNENKRSTYENNYAIITEISEIIENYKKDTNYDQNNEISKSENFDRIINKINELTKSKYYHVVTSEINNVKNIGKCNEINKNNSKDKISVENKNRIDTEVTIGTTIKNGMGIESNEDICLCVKHNCRTKTINNIPTIKPIVENKQILTQRQDILTTDDFREIIAHTVKDKTRLLDTMFNISRILKENIKHTRDKFLHRKQIKFRKKYSYVEGIYKKKIIKQGGRKCISIFKNKIKGYHENPI